MKKLLLLCILCFASACFAQEGYSLAAGQQIAKHGGATTCGDTNIEAGADTGNNNIVIAGAACTPVSTVAVTDCQIYTPTTGSGNIDCAIYDSDGAGSSPGTALCQGTSTAASVGWNVLSLSGCPSLTSGHLYFVAANNNSATTAYRRQVTSGTLWTKAQTFGTFTAITTPTSSTATYSMYLDVH